MKYYADFRKIGYTAERALANAKTLAKFRDYEENGWEARGIRLRAEQETESYFDVYGKPDSTQERDRLIDIFDRLGVWCVISEIYNEDSGKWEHVDSIGMCTGYENPTSPFENDYVIDLMDAAVKAYESKLCLDGAFI